MRSSFDIGIERKLFIARNNLRLNACVCVILLLAQILPLLLPWYADPNYEAPSLNGMPTSSSSIIIYKKKSRMNLIVSLFSVFVDNKWEPINVFIQNECPFVMKSGFECLKMRSFWFAAIGYLALKLTSFAFQINNIVAILQISCNRKHFNKKVITFN